MRILLLVSYDGSNYYGWQKQKSFVSVQEKLEEALSALYRKEISVRGSSRTDTGVHALMQGAVFETENTIPLEKLPYAVNSFLPMDIVVTKAYEVDESFHPQYSVVDKTYHYKILNAPFRVPTLNKYTEFVHYKLDIEAMQKACEYFIGEHDFKAFCAAGSDAKTTVRTIYALSVEKQDNIITISVRGNGFLYNMVRIIAGTLVYVGLDKIKPYDIEKIILSRNRALAGKTLSPNGLTLMEVNYEKIN